MFHYCVILLAVVVPAFINALEDKCKTTNYTLDECFESFSRKWDQIRKEKPQVDAFIFPTLAMTPENFKALCSRVEQAKDDCGNATETCDNHTIAKFIQRNFLYGCRDTFFNDQARCLLSTISGQQQCLALLKRKDDQANSCAPVQEFFKCIHDEVYRSCQAKGLAALVHAIDRFGCDIKSLDATVGAQKAGASCEPLEWQEVASCFQPLLTLWSNIRDNDTNLLNTVFPLFKFQRSDLVKMCDLVHVIRDKCFVQIQRCPDHQLPEFVNAILGSACGTQQSLFFLSHDCIKNTIEENEQCHPYTVGAWQPGHLKESCGRMPAYFKCLEKPITAKCTPEGVEILSLAIRQYGCELETDSSDPSKETVANTIAPTTTTSTVRPLSDGVLEFGASPPAHTIQPPAPPAAPGSLPQQSNPQPILQEPRQQQSFIGAPLDSPGLVGPSKAPGQTVASNQLPPIQPAPPAAILTEPTQTLAPPPPPAVTAATVPTPKLFAQNSGLVPSSFSTLTTSQSQQPSTSTSTTQPSSTAPTTLSTSSTSTSTSTSTTTTHSTSTKPNPTTEHPKGVVVPIPNEPRLLDLCTVEKQNQLRECLNPLYRRWVDIHGAMLSTGHGNLSYPIYHYEKSEVVDLCDQYASAFLRCKFSLFQECLTDDVVYLANAIFGYACSPQNVEEFSRYFDCIANVIKQRRQCSSGIQGALTAVSHQSQARCVGVKEFYSCNRYQIDQSCSPAAERVFRDSLRQSGCEIN